MQTKCCLQQGRTNQQHPAMLPRVGAEAVPSHHHLQPQEQRWAPGTAAGTARSAAPLLCSVPRARPGPAPLRPVHCCSWLLFWHPTPVSSELWL